MSLSNIDYKARAIKAGLNVHFVAEGSSDYTTRLETVVPANPTCNSYSVAKAFVVTAIGILYDKGLLTPDTRVCDLLSDKLPEGYDKKWERVTLHHVIRHYIGIGRDVADIDGEIGGTYPGPFLTSRGRYTDTMTVATIFCQEWLKGHRERIRQSFCVRF